MSWEDRGWAADDNPLRRYGRPGGDWQGLRPTFDNPMSWSLPLGRVARISVRVHVIFLVFIVIEILRAAWPAGGGALDFELAVVMLAGLFVIVLLHEFGHCFACRWWGGGADEILMWPLGGLAYCRPPARWTAHLATALGGPAVNVVLAVVLIPLLGVLTGRWWGVALPNPFSIAGIVAVSRSWGLLALYLVNEVNLVLLLFNLLPIFPLDGGRIMQALLWPRFGYAGSMRLAVRAGYVGAIGLGILGFVLGHVTLVLIAVFGGITCWITHKQLDFTQEAMGFEAGEYAESLFGAREPAGPTAPRPSWRDRRRSRRAQREQREAAAVDDILRKIAGAGIESLSASEKRRLRRATRRKRQTP